MPASKPKPRVLISSRQDHWTKLINNLEMDSVSNHLDESFREQIKEALADIQQHDFFEVPMTNQKKKTKLVKPKGLKEDVIKILSEEAAYTSCSECGVDKAIAKNHRAGLCSMKGKWIHWEEVSDGEYRPFAMTDIIQETAVCPTCLVELDLGHHIIGCEYENQSGGVIKLMQEKYHFVDKEWHCKECDNAFGVGHAEDCTAFTKPPDPTRLNLLELGK